ncbi:1-phosphofructokinase family hexose kinase [Amycolatopsis sp. NPDC054798]
MIVALTPNPAVDVTYRIGVHAPGDTNRVLEVQRRPGGKGVNVARVLAALDVPVRAVLPLGGDAGRWLRTALDVPFDAVPISGETRTTVTVTGDGHPTVYAEPGPEVSEAEWSAFGERLAENLAGAGFLVISGSFPRGASPDLVADWVRIARDAGVRTLVDASGPALLAAARAGAVVKPNRAELLAATSAADEVSGAATLLRLGARLVVVSRGVDGIAAYTPSGARMVPAVPGARGNHYGGGVGDISAVSGVDGNLAGAERSAVAGDISAVPGSRGDPTSAGRSAAAGDISMAPGVHGNSTGVGRSAAGDISVVPDVHGSPTAAARSTAVGDISAVPGEHRNPADASDSAAAGDVLAVPAIPGVHGNPTGAGDAATAGLAAALADGRPLIEALRTAAALGAAAVLRPVAGEVDLSAYRRFLNGAPA